MGTEITVAPTASLTLAGNDEALAILADAEHERDLTEHALAIVQAIALAPAPRPPLATDDDVRNVIGALAGTLKAPRTSREEGQLKLGMYRKALAGHLSGEALSYAGDRALRTLQWMPTPAELIDLAKPYTSKLETLHSKARWLCRERAQRLMDETLKAIARHSLPEADLASLPDRWLAIAETQGGIMRHLDGRFTYRSREAIAEDRAKRQAAHDEWMARVRRDLTPPPLDERDNCARASGELGSGGET